MYHLLYDVGTVSFYIDSTERSGGTYIFALAAADAAFVVNSRHEDCSSVSRSVFNHLNGIRRTMAGTSSAMIAVSHRDTVLLDPHGVTDMNEGFIFLSNSLNGACRANLRATCTLRTAVTALEGHLGLHQSQRIGRRTQHAVRACTDAQLTRRAMALHVPCRHRSRRRDRCIAVRSNLIFDLRQTAIYLNLRLRHSS